MDVTSNPNVQSGAPCVSGTRIPVHAIAGMVKAGDSVESVARDYGLLPDTVRDACRWVEMNEMLNVKARLDELRGMSDGWLDGYGNAPSPAGLDWLSSAFERHYPDDLPAPSLFPNPEGGIEAEWRLGDHRVILSIDIDAHRGEWLRFSMTDDSDQDERRLNLDDSDLWGFIIGEITHLAARVVKA